MTINMEKIIRFKENHSDFIEDFLNPKSYRLDIKTTKGKNKIKPNVEIQLTRIDEKYYDNPKIYSTKTNENGLSSLSPVLEGAYLFQIKDKKYCREELYILSNNDSICSNLPRFQIFKKHIEADNKLIERLIWIFRYDSKFCFKCKEEYFENRRHYCKRCGKYFCGDHRIPEKHGCGDNLKSPSKDFRTIYSRNETEIRY